MIRIGSLFSGAGGLDMAVEHVFGDHWTTLLRKVLEAAELHHQ